MYKRKPVEECPPASKTLLSEFVTILDKSMEYPSIKACLLAVCHYQIGHGFALNLNKMLCQQHFLRGIERSNGQPTRVRPSITINHLKLFKMLLEIPFIRNFDRKIIWAAMTLAFFGFLRLGK